MKEKIFWESFVKKLNLRLQPLFFVVVNFRFFELAPRPEKSNKKNHSNWLDENESSGTVAKWCGTGTTPTSERTS